MSDSEDSAFRSAWQHHLELLNAALRRPGMYGPHESAELLTMEAMAAVDGKLPRWEAERAALRDNGAWSAAGVFGAYRAILPADAARYAATSMYAEIAHRLGWLRPDRTVPKTQWERLRAGVQEWLTQDRTLTEVIETYGAPAVWIGPKGDHQAKTLLYVTTGRHQVITFHLWNAPTETRSGRGARKVRLEPVVLVVRHREGTFADSFSFTPAGLRRKPKGDEINILRRTVWVFHGDQARHAAGVFETLDDALAWAGDHQLTGILAEYAYGGAYDIAVSDSRFTPSRDHHGTAEHVAGFSPGLRHVHVVDGRPDE